MNSLILRKQSFASHLRIATAVTLAAGSVVCALFASQPMSGSQWGQTLTTTVGGAEVLNTTLTVPHWFSVGHFS